MDFSLIKTISQAAQQDDTAFYQLRENVDVFENAQVLCETAEEFLSQLGSKLNMGGQFTGDEVARIAPILATLQLMTQEDTREAILSRFKGNMNTNLITIVKNVSKPTDPAGKIDDVLKQIGEVNARSLMDRNAAILNDPQSQGRKALGTNVQKLSNWFRAYSGRSQGQQQQGQQGQNGNQQQKPAPPPAQQTGQRAPQAPTNQQTGTPAPTGGGMPTPGQ